MIDIELKDIPALRVISVEHTGSIAGVSRAFTELYSRAVAAGAPVGAPPLTIYPESPREFDPGDVTFSVCLPLAGELGELPEGLDVVELPAATAATAVHEGPYEGIGAVYDGLVRWCEREGYRVTPPVREVYLVGPDPDGHRSPVEFRTEVQFPAEKA